jgi:hypothetical protein
MECAWRLLGVLTFAIKTEVSNTAEMCLSQLLPSRPDRNADMEGFFNSHTGHKKHNKSISHSIQLFINTLLFFEDIICSLFVLIKLGISI